MYKPKSTREIYTESLAVNSASLGKQLADESAPPREIKSVIDAVGKMYNENVERIVEECERDMMALERVPSPLKLFVDCLANLQESMNLSPPARTLMRQYTAAWEEWM
jgi:hypothetical protein